MSKFDEAIGGSTPPATWSAALTALWWDARDDWERAHAVIAADEDSEGAAWVHAYLHRREGDAFNAAYWYRRAGRKPSTLALDEERQAIAAALLGA